MKLSTSKCGKTLFSGSTLDHLAWRRVGERPLFVDSFAGGERVA